MYGKVGEEGGCCIGEAVGIEVLVNVAVGIGVEVAVGLAA